jgi:hypothetical protein
MRTSSTLKLLIFVMIIIVLAFIGQVKAIPVISQISFNPTANSGEPINITVHIKDVVDVSKVQIFYEMEDTAFPFDVEMDLVDGTLTNGTWSGSIPAQQWGGTLTFRIITNDGIARYPSEGSLTIKVDGPSESSFPWKWIIIGAFLVVVFIATELAFKPGIWRPTGRQRAQALEEEDRRKEQEEKEKVEEKDQI